MVKARTKRFNKKTYRLYKTGATYGRLGIGSDVADIKERLQKKGFSVRVENNIWGNTYIWIRKRNEKSGRMSRCSKCGKGLEKGQGSRVGRGRGKLVCHSCRMKYLRGS